MIPDFITHYHPAEDPPFKSLSDVADSDLPPILAGLSARYGTSSKRVFGRRYMAFRRATEVKLRTLFETAGGRPERAAPHYFVLGESAWFEGLYASPRSIRFPLRMFRRDVVSFTYPDSVVAMRLGPEFGLPPDPLRPYHETVFRLDQLEDVVGRYGLPKDADVAYEGYHLREFERYIEVQIWSDIEVTP